MNIRFTHLILMLPMVIGSGLSAQPDAFCTRLDSLMGQAGNAIMTVFDPRPLAVPQVQCSPSRGLGGTIALHCAWPFEFRSAQALRAFDTMLGQVTACADPIAAAAASVNHPDSYDLHQFNLGTGVVSVSLKDKGALNQTYVFLRVERPNSP